MAEERAGKKPRNDDAAIADEIFPSKVMEVILMKLPAKYLARFKVVSKYWAETISSPPIQRPPVEIPPGNRVYHLGVAGALRHFLIVEIEFVAQQVHDRSIQVHPRIAGAPALEKLQRRRDVSLERGLFVNGCFYWWDREERLLVGLNVREGTVGMSGGPPELRSDVYLNDKIKLFEVTGRLGLYSKDKEITRVRVWAMEKDGLEACFGTWRELMNITPENEQVCLFGEEDRVVIFTDGTVRESRFLIYQDNSKCYKIVVCNFPADAPWHYLIQHSETLFPLARFLQKNKETAGSSSS